MSKQSSASVALPRRSGGRRASFSFDPKAKGKTSCDHCGEPPSAHDKRRAVPDDGPAGSWHWVYYCANAPDAAVVEP